MMAGSGGAVAEDHLQARRQHKARGRSDRSPTRSASHGWFGAVDDIELDMMLKG